MAEKAEVNQHRVSAILVTHDGQTWLPETVAALTSQTRPIDFIIAVDTGSVDASVQLLKSAQVKVISADRECGFGEAVSIGVDSLIPPTIEGNEWIWLIHDDSAPAPSALEFLLAAVTDRPQVAMVGPKLLGWHDRTHLLEAGISIAGNGARWTGLEALEYDQGQHDGVHDVLSVSTAGALIRRDIFEEIGGFDKNLTLFRDDVDFGWRVRMAGHAVLAVTSAVVFHAQAAASERRSIDVEGALLARPLLLDRRNAAYVLLANSSWWMIPWIAIQLIGSAVARSIGYLLAKLPGYASDEILAVLLLLIKPGIIFKARKARKAQRFISARIIATYIPPRWSQLRLSTFRTLEKVRGYVSLDRAIPSVLNAESTEDEEIFTPNQGFKWLNILRKPEVSFFFFLTIITLLASRNRLGPLIGGALAASPNSSHELWTSYFESWHQVGLGSSHASPPWIAILAVTSTLFFGKAALLITLFFLTAPLLMMWSSVTLFRELTQNKWISVPAAFIYAISPVAVAAINSGRIATVVTLIIAPQIPRALRNWAEIEKLSWRRIFTVALIFTLLYSFTLTAFVILFILCALTIVVDYQRLRLDKDRPLFQLRIYKRLTLLLAPFLVTAPYSFEAIVSPVKFLSEPGILLAGGSSQLVILGNPGGPGSLPWWIMSPLLLVLMLAIFSSSKAKVIALYGTGFLTAAVFFSSFSISAHGDTAPTKLWVGTFLVGATLAASGAAVIILDRLRRVLVTTNIHFRHILSALLLVISAMYSVTTIGWSISAGANSPVQTGSNTVMPAFLTVEKDTKTLVLRSITDANVKSIQFYISRGKDISLGEPDIAPLQSSEIATATQALIDGSGIASSKTFADFGIKYIFAKAPIDQNVIRTIDGLGGFTRASATSVGVVWRVAGVIGRLVLVGADGKRELLQSGEVGSATKITHPGTILLTESFDRSWQILENGYRLARSDATFGMPAFTALEPGEISLIHDGTIRRAWLSFEIIALILLTIGAVPAGRRKREISDRELA